MTVRDRDRDPIESYLFLGAPLDLQAADRYMEDFFSAIGSVEELASVSELSVVLERIVESAVGDSGSSEIVIPLTGGLDSRGILGACLALYGPSRIRCFTYGNLAHSDVRAARKVCDRNGVEWQNVDLNEVEWSIPEMIEVAQQVKAQTGALCACGVVRRNYIESMFGSDAVFLTGFFGGAISVDWGSGERREDINLAVGAFLNSNAFQIPGLQLDVESVQRELSEFVEKWTAKILEYPGLSCADILNFCFRQSMNIKGSVCYFHNSQAPYADPSWIAFWARQPLENRQGRTRYRNELRAAYPELFCLDVDRVGTKPKRKSTLSLASLKRAAFSAFQPGRRDRIDFAMDMKGDITKNDSMREVLSELCDSFYERRVLENYQLKGLVSQVVSTPSKPVWRTIDRVSKAELHLRAGTLLPIKQSGSCELGSR